MRTLEVGRWAATILDLVLGLMVGGVASTWLALRFVRRAMLPAASVTSPERPQLLVLDTSYDLRTIQSQRLERVVQALRLGGYFDHVWSVHPLGGAQDGTPAAATLAPLGNGTTFYQGEAGRFRSLAGLPTVNFVIAQWSVLRRICAIMDSNPIAIVRAGDPYYLGMLGLLLSRLYRVPLLVRISGHYQELYDRHGQLAYPRLLRSRTLERAIARIVLRRSAHVTAGNRHNLGYALAYGVPEERTSVCRYGNLIADPHWREPGARKDVRGKLQIPGAHPYVLVVSRLERVKRPHDAIDAVVHVLGGEPDAYAAIIGDGSMREELERHVGRSGLSERVRFLGAQDQQFIADAMSGAAVHLAPMAGRALVEAALSGRPIVAYDVDWHSELIEQDQTGVLTPVGDARSMAEAALRMLRDPVRATELGARARERALRMMDRHELEARERAMYDSILDSGEGPT